MKYVIVIVEGNYLAFGPFDSVKEAYEWRVSNMLLGEMNRSRIMPLHPPEGENSTKQEEIG